MIKLTDRFLNSCLDQTSYCEMFHPPNVLVYLTYTVQTVLTVLKPNTAKILLYYKIEIIEIKDY